MGLFTRKAGTTTETGVAELGQLLNRPAPPENGAQGVAPKDEYVPRFKENAQSLRRDGAIALMLAGSRLLPFGAGAYLGMGGGALVILNGAIEFIEGARCETKNYRQIIDGGLHALVGLGMVVAGYSASTWVGPAAMIGAGALLGGKVIMDHPTGAAKLLFTETASLVWDPIVGLGLGIKHGAKTLKKKVFG